MQTAVLKEVMTTGPMAFLSNYEFYFVFKNPTILISSIQKNWSFYKNS